MNVKKVEVLRTQKSPFSTEICDAKHGRYIVASKIESFEYLDNGTTIIIMDSGISYIVKGHISFI